MKHKKSYYKELNLEGFTWRYFSNKLHTFVRHSKQGYETLRCTDEDIENGNVYDMIEMNVTK